MAIGIVIFSKKKDIASRYILDKVKGKNPLIVSPLLNIFLSYEKKTINEIIKVHMKYPDPSKFDI